MPIDETILCRFKNKHTCFIETGTYDGDTTMLAIMAGFTSLHTIELDEKKYISAVARFSQYSHVNLYQGNSPSILEKILINIDVPALFWLDAHPGYGDTPLLEELDVIKRHQVKTHTILIDDLRNMGGPLQNVTRKEIENSLLSINPKYKLIYVDDPWASEDILSAIIESSAE